MRPDAVQESELEQQASAESLIPLDVAHVSFRRPEIAADRIAEGNGRPKGCDAVRSETPDDP